MKKIKRKIRKLLVKLIGSPIKIDNKARGRKIKQIAPLPKEIFWDDSVNIHKTKVE